MLLLTFLTLNINVFGSDKSIVKNFSAKEYSGALQNWSVIQGNQGVVYVGNNGAVLVYDGEDWSYISIPNGSTVRSLAKNAQGVIFVGTDDDIGFLHQDENGMLKFKSLRMFLPESYRLSSVWKIYCMEDKVVFYTTSNLIVWDGSALNLIPIQEGSLAQYVKGKLILHDARKGFSYLKEGEVVPIQPADAFPGAVFSILPYGESELLIGTGNDGLFIWKSKLLDPKNDNSFRPLNGNSNDLLQNLTIYNGLQIGDSNYVYGTIKGGVVQIDLQGDVVKRFNNESGLQNNTVYGMCLDAQNGLWLGLSKGISRIEISSPFKNWNESDGLDGVVMSMLNIKGKNYVGTFSGVYLLNEKQEFEKIQGTDGMCWDLAEIEGEVVAASSNGLFHIHDKKVSTLSLFPCYSLYSLGNVLWVGLKNGLTAFQIDDGVFSTNNQEMSLGSNVLSIATRNNFEVWLGTRKNGIICLDLALNRIKKFGLEEGLSSMTGNKVRMFGGYLKVASKKGILTYDETTNRLILDSLLNQKLGTKDAFIHQLQEGALNEYVYTTMEGKSNKYYYTSKDPSGELVVDHNTLQRLPNMDVQLLKLEDKSIWIGGSEGLFRYQKQNDLDVRIPFQTLIRKIIIGKDSILFNGGDYASIWQDISLKNPVSFDMNKLVFQYSSNSFDNNERNQYQFKLVGFDMDWSDWTKESKKEYTNLNEGEYTFKVRAKNTYDKVSATSSIDFCLLPPWYRTVWAYLIYALVVVVLFVVGIKINERRLLAENKRLEGIVIERTKEVVAQKTEIEKKAEEISMQSEEIKIKNQVLHQVNEDISEKNKQITDSIQYAQKIQDAVLPSHNIIEDLFDEHFIFFKPRDIVSGDFYWVHENEDKVFWCAADCTGHGVPGAFMSMIGMSLLNEIVIERAIHSPNDILNQLRSLVISLLNDDQSSNKDGMDIALCVLDKNTQLLEFAGAYNPCYIYRGEELTVLPANQQPVGMHKKDSIPFEKQTYTVQKGDSIYVFSDGYVDQFGGKKGVKFMEKRFQKMILDFQESKMADQGIKFAQIYDKWKGTYMQLDDIVLIGVKV